MQRPLQRSSAADPRQPPLPISVLASCTPKPHQKMRRHPSPSCPCNNDGRPTDRLLSSSKFHTPPPRPRLPPHHPSPPRRGPVTPPDGRSFTFPDMSWALWPTLVDSFLAFLNFISALIGDQTLHLSIIIGLFCTSVYLTAILIDPSLGLWVPLRARAVAVAALIDFDRIPARNVSMIVTGAAAVWSVHPDSCLFSRSSLLILRRVGVLQVAAQSLPGALEASSRTHQHPRCRGSCSSGCVADRDWSG